MKAEDLEEGKIYVMLEDEADVYIEKGHRVRVESVEKGEYSGVVSVVDLDDGHEYEEFYIAIEKLGEINENGEQITDKYEQHRQLCEKIHSTYVAKNKDYGDSFTRTRKEAKYPELVIVTRLSDKFYRLKTLLEGAEQQVKSESIDDTLLDLANYCLMEIIERQNGKEENI